LQGIAGHEMHGNAGKEGRGEDREGEKEGRPEGGQQGGGGSEVAGI